MEQLYFCPFSQFWPFQLHAGSCEECWTSNISLKFCKWAVTDPGENGGKTYHNFSLLSSECLRLDTVIQKREPGLFLCSSLCYFFTVVTATLQHHCTMPEEYPVSPHPWLTDGEMCQASRLAMITWYTDKAVQVRGRRRRWGDVFS